MRYSLRLLLSSGVGLLAGCASPADPDDAGVSVRTEDMVVDPATGETRPRVRAGIEIPLDGKPEKQE